MFPRLFHSLALRAVPFGFSKSTHNEFIVMEKISNAQRHRAEKKKTKVKDWKMLQLLSDWIDGIAKSSAARQLQRLGQCAGRCGLLNTAKFVENAKHNGKHKQTRDSGFLVSLHFLRPSFTVQAMYSHVTGPSIRNNCLTRFFSNKLTNSLLILNGGVLVANAKSMMCEYRRVRANR